MLCPICQLPFESEQEISVHLNHCSSPLLKVRTTPSIKVVDIKEAASNQLVSTRVPPHKLIRSIAVDAFQYGLIEGVQFYFLTHSHADHYTKLTNLFSRVYCTRQTANFIKQKLGFVNSVVLDTGIKYRLTDSIEVELIDANHCPGAVLLLFQVDGQKILHCGDFRAHKIHQDHVELRNLDMLYLDTTYCQQKHVFPAQELVLQRLSQLGAVIIKKDSCDTRQDLTSILEDLGLELQPLSKKNKFVKLDRNQQRITGFFKSSVPSKSVYKTLVMVGTYNIGKERVFMTLAKALKCQAYVTDEKRRLMDCLEDSKLSDILTSVESQLHVVSMQQLRGDYIEEYMARFPQYDRCIAIRPTGWVYKESADIIQAISVAGSRKWAILGVPYSEHSSYSELKAFVQAVSTKKTRVVPTVQCKGADDHIRKWLSSLEN